MGKSKSLLLISMFQDFWGTLEFSRSFHTFVSLRIWQVRRNLIFLCLWCKIFEIKNMESYLMEQRSCSLHDRESSASLFSEWNLFKQDLRFWQTMMAPFLPFKHCPRICNIKYFLASNHFTHNHSSLSPSKLALKTENLKVMRIRQQKEVVY